MLIGKELPAFRIRLPLPSSGCSKNKKVDYPDYGSRELLRIAGNLVSRDTVIPRKAVVFAFCFSLFWNCMPSEKCQYQSV